MDRSHFSSQLRALIFKKNAFLFFSVLSTATALILSILLCVKKERIVIVPTSGPSFWIESQAASSTYVEKMGLYLSDLLLNRSPADADLRNQTILGHVHPLSYHDFKKRLLQDSSALSKNDQSCFFKIEKFQTQGTSFVITGESVMLIGQQGAGAACTQNKPMQYTLQFRQDNGKLLLVSMKKEEL